MSLFRALAAAPEFAPFGRRGGVAESGTLDADAFRPLTLKRLPQPRILASEIRS